MNPRRSGCKGSGSADGNDNRDAFTVGWIQTHRRSTATNSGVLPEILQDVEAPAATGEWNGRRTKKSEGTEGRPVDLLVGQQ